MPEPGRLVSLLLPALFPSWRFFDRIGPAPEARLGLSPASGGPLTWHPLAPRRASRSIGALVISIFHNPARNEALYIMSLAERLVTEDRAHAAQELQRFAAARAAALGAEAFFLSVWTRDPASGAEEEVYRSGPHGAA